MRTLSVCVLVLLLLVTQIISGFYISRFSYCQCFAVENLLLEDFYSDLSGCKVLTLALFIIIASTWMALRRDLPAVSGNFFIICEVLGMA